MTGITSPVAAWCTESDLPESCSNELVKPATLTKAFELSSMVLYNITKRRWPGERTDIIRPCCDCLGKYRCLCAPWNSIQLVGFPVNSVDYVKIDGVDAAATDYELRDQSRIVPVRRVDGSILLIPRYQDLTRAVGETNTVAISYKWGASPPTMAATMAAILGYEIALSWTPATLSSCRLPKRITSITRQGLTVAMIDPLSLFDKGLTGLPEVDLWTRSLEFGDSHNDAEIYDPMKLHNVTRI